MKSIVKSLLKASIASIIFTSFSYAGDSAIVNINGSVLANTCTPSWTTGGGATITIPPDSASEFPTTGSVGTQQGTGTLTLTNCGADVNVINVTSSGAIADSNDSTLFEDSNSSGASGVGFYVTLNTTPLVPNSATPIAVTPAGGNATISLASNLKSTMSNVTAGTVSTTFTLLFDYQ